MFREQHVEWREEHLTDRVLLEMALDQIQESPQDPLMTPRWGGRHVVCPFDDLVKQTIAWNLREVVVGEFGGGMFRHHLPRLEHGLYHRPYVVSFGATWTPPQERTNAMPSSRDFSGGRSTPSTSSSLRSSSRTSRMRSDD